MTTTPESRMTLLDSAIVVVRLTLLVLIVIKIDGSIVTVTLLLIKYQFLGFVD